jgi:hypothetical protein
MVIKMVLDARGGVAWVLRSVARRPGNAQRSATI